jgi:hypothetical protein
VSVWWSSFGCFSPALLFALIALGIAYDVSLKFGQFATDWGKKRERNTDADLSLSFAVHFH